MIRLQRASAGSGKTYTLAVSFLQFFLGIKQPDGLYRLRTEKELSLSHSHILAVTFTRKATNEMKDRIVGRLAQLAYAPGSDREFLRRFAEPFEFAWPAGTVPPEDVVDRIARAAHSGLRELLSNYSFLNVSTIDSFFQSVLRSFSYETDMPDDYGVELDDSLVIEQSLDNVLRDVRHYGGDEDARYWLRQYMEMRVDTGRRWNVMRKGDMAYREVMEYLAMISRERFKATRLKLTEFFEANKQFRLNAQKINVLLDGYITEAHKAVCRAAGALNDLIDGIMDGGQKLVNSYLLKRLREIGEIPPTAVVSGKLRYENALTKAGEKRLSQSAAETEFHELTETFYLALEKWVSEVKYASVIRENLHVLGLLRPLLEQIALYLKDNNMVQLSDTNSFLSRIINTDDAPFIYEKIGFFLRHYLIDEFQDTSRMQWVNLSPLLEESLSSGADTIGITETDDVMGYPGSENDSLIIGDAKQSIYRFRNADPNLISEEVEQTFGSKVELRGMTPQENTNYRSAPPVVEFNNALFKALAAKLPCVGDVYGNVEQLAALSDRPGYVQLTLSNLNTVPDAYESDNDRQTIPYLGPMIHDLLERGYRQNEIAVLVRTNKLGKDVINSIMEYNTTLPPDVAPINFISADSLEIGRSRAVKIIVSVLRMLVCMEDDFDEGRVSADRPYIPTTKAFLRYLDSTRAYDNPKEQAECMEAYFSGAAGTDIVPELYTLVKDLKTTVLPAVVETIISRYVRPASLLTSEAPFIAAFQDTVLDYCERYPADVASFLKYYDMKGKTRTIASPQDTEAVNILTIHSSKGLQFRVVICPELKISTAPYREKLWVHPDPQGSHPDVATLLPELLPVAASATLLNGTPWQPEIDRLSREALLDAVNMAYVAFTRAEDELYVILANSYDRRTGKAGPPSNSISELVWTTLNNREPELNEELYRTIEGEIPGISYGTLPSSDEIARLRKDQTRIPTFVMDCYDPDNGLCRVRFTTEEDEEEIDDLTAEEDNPTEDETPAEEVTAQNEEEAAEELSDEARLYRRILLRLTTASSLENDLKRAMLTEALRGKIDRHMLPELQSMVEQWLRAPGVMSLFADGLRVISRRRLINAGGRGWEGVSHYVDRLTVDSDGNATAISIYPMTEPSKEHLRTATLQRDALRQSGLYSTVTALIWYPSSAIILPVD